MEDFLKEFYKMPTQIFFHLLKDYHLQVIESNRIPEVFLFCSDVTILPNFFPTFHYRYQHFFALQYYPIFEIHYYNVVLLQHNPQDLQSSQNVHHYIQPDPKCHTIELL